MAYGIGNIHKWIQQAIITAAENVYAFILIKIPIWYALTAENIIKCLIYNRSPLKNIIINIKGTSILWQNNSKEQYRIQHYYKHRYQISGFIFHCVTLQKRTILYTAVCVLRAACKPTSESSNIILSSGVQWK